MIPIFIAVPIVDSIIPNTFYAPLFAFQKSIKTVYTHKRSTHYKNKMQTIERVEVGQNNKDHSWSVWKCILGIL